MKPSKEEVFELVRKTKQAVAGYHELKAQADKDGTPENRMKAEKAGYKAAELNKELKAVMALFTEDERNQMREEFNK
jgi:hypothetical protein